MRCLLISLFLLVLFLFSGCRQESTQSYISIPQDSVIDRSTMIIMLADVHIAEAELQIERTRSVNAQKLSAKYYAALFMKYKISEKRFRGSIEYYKQDQGKFIKLYDEVIAELEKRSENIKGEKQLNPEE